MLDVQITVNSGIALITVKVPPHPLSLPVPCYIPWDTLVVYNEGDRVSQSGVNYQASFWNQGTPPVDNNGPIDSGKAWLALGPCVVSVHTAPVTTYIWQVYSASTGMDVGSPFTTTDDRSAATVFDTAISSSNGNAALTTESGFSVPVQTYDVNSGNHVLYSHGATKFQPTDLLPTDGVGFDGSSIPSIFISFMINGGGTRSAGIRCTNVATA